MSIAERRKSAREPVAWVQRHPGLAEFGIIGGCLLIYFLIRGSVVDRPAAAFEHAIDLMGLERRLGFFWEPAWQRAIRGSGLQTHLWNYVYFWLHAPAIAAVAFWLYFRHRRVYGLMRNSFLVSALIALLLYAAYPVAPPRLMTPAGYQEYGVAAAAAPSYGFEDTMREYSSVSYQAESLKPFVNPFAAMPSLHFGWAFLIGAGVALALRNRFGAAVAVAWPLLMLLGIVMTANHFIFDAVAGCAVCLIGLATAFALAHIPETLRRRLTPTFLRQSPALQSGAD